MSEIRIENNKSTLSGKITRNFEFNHECCGEKFYIATLESERRSTEKDTILIMVSDRLVDVKKDWVGKIVRISGQFRSYNRHEDNKNRLVLSVFARKFSSELEENFVFNENCISLNGNICKLPVYRKTPQGREIAEIFLAVNRPYGKSDYIPCICWGRNARFASGLKVGTRLQIEGRIQSREYQKRISDDEYETRIAYEVSTSRLEVVKNEQSKD